MTMDWFGAKLRPMAGGYSGETFLVGDESDNAAPGDAVVLRIYSRHPDRCLVDASLLALVAGIVPAPRVVDVRPPQGDRPGVLVTTRLPGERLDLLLPSASAEMRTTLGRTLGRVLARLSGIAMLRFGMFGGPDLHLATDAPVGLTEWAQHFRDSGRLAAWRAEDWESLLTLIDGAETLLQGGDGEDRANDSRADAARSRRVLVHSDFNPKNILVDPRSGDVTGVLDWEFAHAGSPYADLGNLTRFERHRDFVEEVVSTFVVHAPRLADHPLQMSRAADLWALVELAGGVPVNPVRELSTRLLLAQARAGDLQAWPWDTPRVDP